MGLSKVPAQTDLKKNILQYLLTTIIFAVYIDGRAV